MATAITFSPSQTLSEALLLFGNDAQKAKYLPPIARGEKICSMAITEPQAGSDVAGISTTYMEMEGKHFLLNGKKNMVTNGGIADLYLVLARNVGSTSAKGLSAFIVEGNNPGISAGKKEGLMGLRGLVVTELQFDQCRVPIENLLGKEGEGFRSIMRLFGFSRTVVAAMGVGLAQSAFEFALEYARKRIQFGQPIGEFQGIQYLLADMHAQIEASRLLVFRSAHRWSQGLQNTRAACVAKAFGSDATMHVTLDAVQILGGYGYLISYPVERFMREAKLLQIWEGTNQINRMVIGRSLVRGRYSG
jgi:alkylation response protein AidB-like acyl-CoA dehydrogenase